MRKPEQSNPSKVIIVPRPPVGGGSTGTKSEDGQNPDGNVEGGEGGTESDLSNLFGLK